MRMQTITIRFARLMNFTGRGKRFSDAAMMAKTRVGLMARSRISTRASSSVVRVCRVKGRNWPMTSAKEPGSQDQCSNFQSASDPWVRQQELLPLLQNGQHGLRYASQWVYVADAQTRTQRR